MLSETQIRALFPRAPEPHVQAFERRNGELFQRFGIDDSATRLHFFLAQIGHESGGLTITEESLNYRAERLCQVWPGRFPDIESARPFAGNPERLANNVYANRMGNGGPKSGDGWRYRGRGYIQITGRDGYERVGEAAALDLPDNSDLAFAPEHGLLVSCAFWRWKGLNALCDSGDFVRVTRRINGGTTGLADRRAWLDKVRRILGAPPPVAQPAPQMVIAVQRGLQARGYREVGAADGVVGPRTLAAITRFHQEKGLPEGVIDDALLAALGVEV